MEQIGNPIVLRGQRDAIAAAVHQAVGPLVPDDKLMMLRRVEAGIIHAHYREAAHEVLAAAAYQDILDYLLDMALAEQYLHDDQRSAA
jgi:hypothetical protein